MGIANAPRRKTAAPAGRLEDDREPNFLRKSDGVIPVGHDTVAGRGDSGLLESLLEVCLMENASHGLRRHALKPERLAGAGNRFQQCFGCRDDLSEIAVPGSESVGRGEQLRRIVDIINCLKSAEHLGASAIRRLVAYAKPGDALQRCKRASTAQ